MPAWAVDGLLAAILLVQSVGELVVKQSWGGGSHFAQLIGAGLATAPLIVRRRFPAVVAVLASIGFGVTWVGGAPPQAFGESVGFLIAVYSVVVHGTRRWRILGALAASVAAAAAVSWATPGYDLGGRIISLAWILLPIIVGVVVRGYRRRADLAEHRSEAEVAQILAAERASIARELHDVIAHALTVVVLHSRGGRHAVGDADRRVAEAFDVIEDVAESALDDMRRLLALLREPVAGGSGALPPGDSLDPSPSLRYLHDLSESVCRAGVHVKLDVIGCLTDLPSGLDAVAYRFVQEALTNVLKHAVPADACVRIVLDGQVLELEVIDDGPHVGPVDAGHGLIGMRERVEVFGGHFESGPCSDRGFRVHATIPVMPR